MGGKGEWIWGRWLILTFVVLSAMLLGDINQFCGFRRMGEVRYARSAAVVRCAERLRISVNVTERFANT